jgi:ABC-type branched-subunit amino acid transport system ATPase component
MMLQVKNISAGYGTIEILHDVSIQVDKSEIVTIIGPNGSGKSTLLKTIMGYTRIFRGCIDYKGKRIDRLRSDERIKKGVGYVPQLDNVFPNLNVRENLEMGGFLSSNVENKIKEIHDLFPILRKREKQKAGTMSGGERQMLAIGRSLMLTPDLLLLDEPSSGLTRRLAEFLFEKIKQLDSSIIIVEQNALLALNISDRCYVMSEGTIKISDDANKVLKSTDLRKAYFGD